MAFFLHDPLQTVHEILSFESLKQNVVCTISLTLLGCVGLSRHLIPLYGLLRLPIQYFVVFHRRYAREDGVYNAEKADNHLSVWRDVQTDINTS